MFVSFIFLSIRLYSFLSLESLESLEINVEHSTHANASQFAQKLSYTHFYTRTHENYLQIESQCEIVKQAAFFQIASYTM